MLMLKLMVLLILMLNVDVDADIVTLAVAHFGAYHRRKVIFLKLVTVTTLFGRPRLHNL